MAILKIKHLSKGVHEQLAAQAAKEPETFFYSPVEFDFPIERFHDIFNKDLRRGWLFDLSDDVKAANMRYNTATDTVSINFGMNDLDLPEITLTISDADMKSLIHEAGHCDLSSGRLQIEVVTGIDYRDGSPKAEMRTVSVFDWVDAYANDYKVLLSLLTAYLFDHASEVFATPDTDKEGQPSETPDSTTGRNRRFAWEILPTHENLTA